MLAAAATVTIPNEPDVPVADVGLREMEAGCPCGVSVTCVCTLWPLYVPVTVTGVLAETLLVGIWKTMEGLPAATVSTAGTCTAGELLVKLMAAPLCGATPLSMAIACT